MLKAPEAFEIWVSDHVGLGTALVTTNAIIANIGRSTILGDDNDGFIIETLRSMGNHARWTLRQVLPPQALIARWEPVSCLAVG